MNALILLLTTALPQEQITVELPSVGVNITTQQTQS